MKLVDTILVAIILAGAVFYLYRVFKPKPKKGGGCGCGTVDCKAPKPKVAARVPPHQP